MTTTEPACKRPKRPPSIAGDCGGYKTAGLGSLERGQLGFGRITMGASGQLSPEMISAEVVRYWSVFASKQEERLQEFYEPNAIVFPSSAKRSEPGSITVVRRSRVYFTAQARLLHSLGNIDVQKMGDQYAIASYTFRFEAKNVAGGLGTLRDEVIAHGRATQVFKSEDGTLRIVHEHFSAATS